MASGRRRTDAVRAQALLFLIAEAFTLAASVVMARTLAETP
jgi:hypothetical protein